MSSGPPPTEEQEPTHISRSDAALARYASRTKRSRIWYFSIVAVIVVVLGVFAAVVWANGEAAHVTLHTAAAPPAALPVQSPAARQQQAWHSSDQLALGYPVRSGTVITYSRNTVRGRSVRTGATSWSYNRSDRTVCTAVQLGGITMAIYAIGGSCDEISAFHTGTGKRAWTRTLDEDGMPLDGRPDYTWTGGTLMMQTSSVIYAIDPSSGLDRWTYTRYGCRIKHAVLGTAGALISQTCTTPRCANVDHCGPGPQLFLRDGTAGTGDDSKPGADHIFWNDIGNSDVPVAAGNVVGALNPTTRQVDRYSQNNGKPVGTTTLSPAPPATADPRTTQTDAADLVLLGDHLYALDAARTPLWVRSTTASPTLDAGDDGSTPTLSKTRISVPSATGVTIVDGHTGAVADAVQLPEPPAPGDLVYAAGSGYVAGGRTGVTAYR